MAWRPGQPWRVARALDVLRQQINTASPDRDKRLDGTIGDLAHQQGYSEHNPNSAGVVRAIDITHDPKNGVDGDRLAADVIAELDRRGVKAYVIWRGRIRSTYVAKGVWRTYRGSNPHNHHVHISYISGYDSTKPWDLSRGGQLVVNSDVPAVKAPPWPLPDGHLIYLNPKRYATWHDGQGNDTTGRAAIKQWQERMIERGWDLGKFGADGYYGPTSADVCKSFQEEKGLAVDGIVGPLTWSRTWEAVTTL